ncbi:DUF6538 domain-containing protein [Bradyrhizobium sp. Ash2021]|uniref:DUF6538 domain-containing protein n=1 Tax=Bradyrhizobium sp. Ash2021 TaxID=2954771 RepID=UPI0035BF7E9F
MLPQCSHITKKRGVYYYRRRVPKSPGREVVLSLRTRVFRVAECLATGLDQEFGMRASLPSRTLRTAPNS